MALAAADAASSGTAAEAMSTRASRDGRVRSVKSGLAASSSSLRWMKRCLMPDLLQILVSLPLRSVRCSLLVTRK
jgi:hypothetical protein